MPPTSVTAPTTPSTPTMAAISAGRAVAPDRDGPVSNARLAPTAAGTGAPTRVAAPTSWARRVRIRPVSRPTVIQATRAHARSVTTTVAATPTASIGPLR